MSKHFEFTKVKTLAREGNASTLCPDRTQCLCLNKIFDEVFPAYRIVKSTEDFQLQVVTHAENLRELFWYHREQMEGISCSNSPASRHSRRLDFGSTGAA